MVAEALPSYMCPSAFVCHNALPTNANGKIDRAQLREPTADDFVASMSADRAPRGAIEQALANSWATLLHMDAVPVTADFYDLGGTSLLAVMCIDELQREHGIELAPSSLITAGSIENIAALIAAESSSDRGASDTNAHSTGLVQMQDHPGSAPLFLYPGEAVSALGMVELARGLAPDRSVWVFEPARPLDHEPGPSMSELAQRCRPTHRGWSAASLGRAFANRARWCVPDLSRIRVEEPHRKHQLAVAGALRASDARCAHQSSGQQPRPPPDRRQGHLQDHDAGREVARSQRDA